MFEMRQAEHLGREECIASLKKSITKYSDIVRNVNTKDVEKVSVGDSSDAFVWRSFLSSSFVFLCLGTSVRIRVPTKRTKKQKTT